MLRPIIDVLAALGLFLVILTITFIYSVAELSSTTQFNDEDGCYFTAKYLSLRPSEDNLDYPVVVFIKKDHCV